MSTVAPEKKELRSALSKAGLSRVDKDVLGKCVALASTLHLSPEQMAECWETFSLNKNVTELTSHTFEAYKTQVHKLSDIAPSLSQSSAGAVQPRSVKRQATNMVTPPAAKRKPVGPDKPTSSVDAVAVNAPSSPLRRTPTQMPKYGERKKVGEVVVSFNPKEYPRVRASQSTKAHCDVETSEFDETFNITKPYRHMFTATTERAQALEKHLDTMGQEIVKRYGISDGDNGTAPLEQVNVPRQEVVCCVGRICNEAHEGKLNSTSIVLEGTSAKCGGARVNVDLSHLMKNKMSYSLFPGQIVAVEGMNPTGRKLVAQRICEGAAHDAATSQIRELRDFHYEKQAGEPVKVVSASGPFTTSDNLDYAPLIDLMRTILDQTPDVAILTGPFVDVRQARIKKGSAITETVDGATRTSDYETFFANKISDLIQEAFDPETNLKTQFVLVPSLEDATAKWVFPQPPLSDSQEQPTNLDFKPDRVTTGTLGLAQINEGQKSPRVHCLSNPCTFKVNEVVFGVTSTDVLFHMSAEETNSNLEPGSRLRRIAQHMVQQRSYYPLFPPPSSLPTNLDLKRMDNWQMPCKPDVLIVPSRLACLATPVLDNTVVINPGHLAKGTTGGTYATMDIHPIARASLDESGGDDVQMQHGVHDRINIEVKRV